MSGAEQGSDILATLPTWAQIAANLGMLTVAVIAAVFGFSKKIVGAFGDHDEDKMSLEHRPLIDVLIRLTEAIEGVLKVMQAREREDEIQREVKRRLHQNEQE